MEFEVAASNSLGGWIEVVASNGLKSLIKLYLMFKPRKNVMCFHMCNVCVLGTPQNRQVRDGSFLKKIDSFLEL